MKIKNDFTLIDGKFNPEGAAKVLFALVNSKINYHNLEAFSNHERHGSDVTKAEKRIKQLQVVNSQIKKAIEYAVKHNLDVELNGTINIKFIENGNEKKSNK